jgi:prepilin-type N-terminal cleavage/methylation domain-containing protein
MRACFHKLSDNQGFTLIEMLISAMISSIVVVGASTIYFIGVTNYHDRRIKAETDETAQMLLDIIANDIKLAGNGLPQTANWNGPTNSLAIPFIADHTDNATITMRSSKTGKVTMTTAAVTPGLFAFTINVEDRIFNTGDRIFLNSMAVGLEHSMMGYVEKANNKVLTISGAEDESTAPSYPSGVVFPVGSMVYNIPYIAYISTDDWSGIKVWEGGILDESFGGAVLMAPNTTFELEFLNANLGTVAINNANIMNSLALIKVTVTARGTSPLTDGSTYETWAQKTVAPRFLTVNKAQSWN